MMNKEKAKIRKRKKEHINKFDIRIFFIIIIITVISILVIFQSVQIIIGLVKGSKKLIEDWINRDVSYSIEESFNIERI
ncbi:MAG: hypothetical protein HFJ43_00085 [Clostridia bacterium]|nr:hypothetical protein [Clostridia bacterium]